MIWFIVILGVMLLVAAGLVFSAPFLDFLAPSSNIQLYDLTDMTNPVLLAQGSSTLWYQWQIWGYIFLFCTALFILGCIIASYVLKISDEQIIKKQAQLDEKIQEYERSKKTFEQKKTKELEAHFEEEKQFIQKYSQEATDKEAHAIALKEHAQRVNNETHRSILKQTKINKGKAAQGIKLKEQKKLIINYLDSGAWQLNGERLTYQKLVELAKEHKKNNQD